MLIALEGKDGKDIKDITFWFSPPPAGVSTVGGRTGDVIRIGGARRRRSGDQSSGKASAF